MINREILISGASIAGPALAFWLKRYGFLPTVVERAPVLREGGYKIDLRGTAIDVAERMNILDAIRHESTDMQSTTFVGAGGKPIATLSAELFGLREARDVEVMRGALSRILFEAGREHVEYLFGDSIASISPNGERLAVTFERNEPREFDLVVGADGVHSNVRSLVFGDESTFARDFGYFVAVFAAPNTEGLDRSELVYVAPGRTANIYCTRGETEARVLLMFPSAPLSYDRRNIEQQKQIVAEAFKDEGWRVPDLLRAMSAAKDFYFDRIGQIQMDQWFQGRVALLGDAGYGPSLASGQGSSQALVGAYVLASELAAAGGDHRVAFGNYERRMRPYVEKNQAIGRDSVKHMVARSRADVWFQSFGLRTLPYVPFAGAFIKRLKRSVEKAACAISIADYDRFSGGRS